MNIRETNSWTRKPGENMNSSDETNSSENDQKALIKNTKQSPNVENEELNIKSGRMQIPTYNEFSMNPESLPVRDQGLAYSSNEETLLTYSPKAKRRVTEEGFVSTEETESTDDGKGLQCSIVIDDDYDEEDAIYNLDYFAASGDEDISIRIEDTTNKEYNEWMKFNNPTFSSESDCTNSTHSMEESADEIEAENEQPAEYVEIADQFVCLKNEECITCVPKCICNMVSQITYYGQIFEMTDENLLGKGGEGNVYCGIWHGEPAAFKTFEFDGNTDDAAMVIGQMQNAIEELGELIKLQKEIDENEDDKSNKTYVLFPLGHFRQATNNKFYDVFVYPICKGGDLSDYLRKHNPEYEELKEIFLQMAKRIVIYSHFEYSYSTTCITLKSVKTVSRYNKKHNDIKPSNFLIKSDSSLLDEENELLLSDFGFMNERKGGTPLYASPECFEGTFVEKSDIYSLGGCFVSLLSNDKTLAKLLLLPLLTDNEVKLAEKVLKKNSLLQLAKQMLNSNPAKRPSIDTIIEKLENTPPSLFNNIIKNNKDLSYLLYSFSQGQITSLLQDHLLDME